MEATDTTRRKLVTGILAASITGVPWPSNAGGDSGAGGDDISVWDFIPPGQHNGIKSRISDYDCVSDLRRWMEQAQAYSGRGVLPMGLFKLGSQLSVPPHMERSLEHLGC